MLESIKRIWIIETVSLIIINFMSIKITNGLGNVMLFPFIQISELLRGLSLSGIIGNGIAVVLYVFICILPVIYMIKKRNSTSLEKGLLITLSIVLFVGIYLMINPLLIYEIINITLRVSEVELMFKTIIVLLIYSTLIGYITIRVISISDESDITKLMKVASLMLVLLNVIFVFLIFGINFNTMINSFNNLAVNSFVEEIFIVVNFIKESLPYLISIIVIYKAILLINEIIKDRYSDNSVTAAKKLSDICVKSLKIIVITNIIINVSYLLFSKHLLNVHFSVDISITSILLILAVFLITRLITENSILKNENDQFI